MSTGAIWSRDNSLVVTVRGPGKLHLLSYQGPAVVEGVRNAVGSIDITTTGITYIMIGFSHNYNQYAFYWDGARRAVYTIGSSLQRQPVATSWQAANGLGWGDTAVGTRDVSGIVGSAVNRDNETTLYVIPDRILEWISGAGGN